MIALPRDTMTWATSPSHLSHVRERTLLTCTPRLRWIPEQAIDRAHQCWRLRLDFFFVCIDLPMHNVIPRLILAHSGFSAEQSQHRSFPATAKISDNILSLLFSLSKHQDKNSKRKEQYQTNQNRLGCRGVVSTVVTVLAIFGVTPWWLTAGQAVPWATSTTEHQLHGRAYFFLYSLDPNLEHFFRVRL